LTVIHSTAAIKFAFGAVHSSSPDSYMNFSLATLKTVSSLIYDARLDQMFLEADRISQKLQIPSYTTFDFESEAWQVPGCNPAPKHLIQ
jgi:hypothetical protein